MAGLITNQKHAIVTAGNGLTMETYPTMRALAESAAWLAHLELGSQEAHIAWLRGMADKMEGIHQRASDPVGDEAKEWDTDSCSCGE